MDPIQFLVCVRCITYNHAPYIIDAMNGFIMQETTFPFVCTIIDDASTDGEQKVIKTYLEEHFDLNDKSIVRSEESDDYIMTFARHKTNHNCFFAVYFLKYNHYSIKKNKYFYIQEWTTTKYTALCEGDDYWTDSDKLQIQVDYLDANSTYSMCWHDASILDNNSKQICGNNRRYTNNTTCPTEDMIIGGGGFCPTASFLYRNGLLKKAPPELFKQSVGDYPLQLFMSFVGKVYYIDRNMSVYRINVPGSWTSKQLYNDSVEIRRKSWDETLKIYKDFNAYSNYKYNNAFLERENTFLYNEAMRVSDFKLAKKCWYRIPLKRRPLGLKIILLLHGLGHFKMWIKKDYR